MRLPTTSTFTGATPAPTITVVIAVLNGADTLQAALDSAFAQTYEHLEILVMDGASVDGSREILQRNAGRITYWESNPDRGIYHAWNKALDHATGDWICFLGADDRFTSPDVLRRMAAAISTASGSLRVAYASVNLVARDGSIISTRGAPWPAVRKEFMAGMAIPHQATFHHRDLFARHGRFDETFRIAGDYELLLRELRSREAVFVPGLIAVDMGADGMSDRPENRVKRIEEFERARRMHGLAAGPEWRSPAVVRVRVRSLIGRTIGPRAEASTTSAYRAIRAWIRRWTSGAR